MTPSQRARSRKVRPTRKAGECYSKDSHARAIARACKAVNDARLKRDGNDTVLMNGWTPHPLRHNFATEIASKLNDEASRVVLDHSSKSATEIYIDEDIEKARAVIAKIG